MKTINLSILVLFLLFLAACSKEEQMISNNISTSDSNLKEGNTTKGGSPNSFYEANLPMIKFIPTDGQKNTFTVKLNDPAQTTTVRVDGRIRFQDQNQSRANTQYNDVFFKIENMKTAGKASNIVFPPNFDKQISNVYLEYSVGNVVVATYDYNVYTYSDFTVALQQPTLKTNNKGLVGRWNFDDAAGQESSGMVEFSVGVINDPAELVTAVEVVFDEKTSSPAPKTYTNYLKKKAKYGQSMIFSCPIAFSENPANSSYNIKVTLLDANGKALANPVYAVTKPVSNKEKASIHSVRIREYKNESGKLNYEMAGVVLNMKPEKLGFVDVKFLETKFEGKPSVLQNASTWRMKKRPELLYSEWDNIINDYVNEIQNNPIHVGSDNTHFSPLFAKSAVGYSYMVSATMYDKNGKQLGEEQTFEVTVEGNVNEPTLLSTRLYSPDKGATWYYEVVYEDKDQWLEKVQVEFIDPFEGPKPLNNPLTLSLKDSQKANIRIGTAKVEFSMGASPAGFFYNTLIQGFGTGTRSTASQAGNKAELL